MCHSRPFRSIPCPRRSPSAPSPRKRRTTTHQTTPRNRPTPECITRRDEPPRRDKRTGSSPRSMWRPLGNWQTGRKPTALPNKTAAESIPRKLPRLARARRNLPAPPPRPFRHSARGSRTSSPPRPKPTAPDNPQSRRMLPPSNRKTVPESIPRKLARWARRNPPARPPRPFRCSGRDNRTSSPPYSKPRARCNPQTGRKPPPPNRKTVPESIPRKPPRRARRNPPAFPHSGIRTGSPFPRYPARRPRRIRIDSQRGLMSPPSGNRQTRHIPPPPNRKTAPESIPRKLARWARRNLPARPHRPFRYLARGNRTSSPPRPKPPAWCIPQTRHIPPPPNRKTATESAPCKLLCWERRKSPAPPPRPFQHSERGNRTSSPPRSKPTARCIPQLRHIPPPPNRKTAPESIPRKLPRLARARRNLPAPPPRPFRHSARGNRTSSPPRSKPTAPGNSQSRHMPPTPNRKTAAESIPRKLPRWRRRNLPARPPRPFRYSARGNRTSSSPYSKPRARCIPQTGRKPTALPSKTAPESIPRNFPRWARRNPPARPPRPFRHSEPDNRTSSSPHSKPLARCKPQSGRKPTGLPSKTAAESIPRNFPRWARRNPPARPHRPFRHSARGNRTSSLLRSKPLARCIPPPRIRRWHPAAPPRRGRSRRRRCNRTSHDTQRG